MLMSEDARGLDWFLDRTGVDRLWLPGGHVDWVNGRRDRREQGGRESHTHCSAFVAAIAMRLGVYILRPPAHAQELLANAQARWLHEGGARHGWRKLSGEYAAQGAADRGELVVASFRNPDAAVPGHIAIVRGANRDRWSIDRDGPQITQAGGRNYVSTTLATGFTWRRPSVRYFAHPL